MFRRGFMSKGCTSACADEQAYVVPAVMVSPDGLIEAFYDREAARHRVTASADGSRAPDGSSEQSPQRQWRRHGATDMARDTPLMTPRSQAAAEVVSDRRLLLAAHTGGVRVTSTPVGVRGDRISLPCGHEHELVTGPRDAQVVSAHGSNMTEVKLLGVDARSTSEAPRTVGRAPHLPPPKGKRALADVPLGVTAAALGAPRNVRISELKTEGHRLGDGARRTSKAPKKVGGMLPLPSPGGEQVLPDVPVGVTAAGTGVGRYALLRGPPVSWALEAVDTITVRAELFKGGISRPKKN